jgi:predicted metal-dependent phosphoesterase TrpH
MPKVTHMASFHNHTKYSDGSFLAEELVEKVHELNVELVKRREATIRGLAIVDHEFYPSEAEIAHLREYAAQFDMQLIFGTEISTDSAQVHIIGYEIEPRNYSFYRYVIREHYKRLEAFEDTCRRLNKLFIGEGTSIHLDQDVGLRALNKDPQQRVIGYGPLRWHYLREAMVEKGMAKTTREANGLIGPGGPCYHQRETANSVEMVELIREWGGKPVLAHPHRIPEMFRWRVIRSLMAAGLFGIEAYTESYAEPEESNEYVKLAQENGLLALAGTDLHGNIGDVGRFLLPYEAFQKLKGERG